MTTIKYIGFYTKDKDHGTRHGSIAATNKMDYICCAINDAGYNVNIISPSWIDDDRKGFHSQYTITESESKTITFAPSFGTKNRYLKKLTVIYSKIWLLLYLIQCIDKNEKVLVYHSPYLVNIILWIKNIKKINLILEVNEIYSDVKIFSNNIKKNEYKLFSLADSYIFATELLNEKLNAEKKHYAINYGTYRIQEEKKCKFADDKIHIVYAGIINKLKGSLMAVKTAAHLDNKYHIHIIGFGSNNDVIFTKKLIQQISKETTCKVTYDGLLNGEEYITFLQKCNIGLSTQSPEAAYNDTSFPSKVLSYLANGLRVVSIRIKAIEQSEIGNMIYFYEKDTPESIAKSIENIDFVAAYDSRKKIQELNKNFITRIKRLFS